jgi:protein-tyrosine phosphatase
MTLKARWRDLKTSLTSDPPVNPALPGKVRTVLFVCLGNICRSPFAGALLARRLAERGDATIVSVSAGLRTTQAKRSPAEACAAAVPYGVVLDSHVPQQLTPQMMADADMIVVMELAQFTQLRAMYPTLQHRIFLMSLWDSEASGAYAKYNIVDPFGQKIDAFHACYGRISRSVDRLLSVLRPRATTRAAS